jgi:hypothetical protein
MLDDLQKKECSAAKKYSPARIMQDYATNSSLITDLLKDAAPGVDAMVQTKLQAYRSLAGGEPDGESQQQHAVTTPASRRLQEDFLKGQEPLMRFLLQENLGGMSTPTSEPVMGSVGVVTMKSQDIVAAAKNPGAQWQKVSPASDRPIQVLKGRLSQVSVVQKCDTAGPSVQITPSTVSNNCRLDVILAVSLQQTSPPGEVRKKYSHCSFTNVGFFTEWYNSEDDAEKKRHGATGEDFVAWSELDTVTFEFKIVGHGDIPPTGAPDIELEFKYDGLQNSQASYKGFKSWFATMRHSAVLLSTVRDLFEHAVPGMPFVEVFTNAGHLLFPQCVKDDFLEPGSAEDFSGGDGRAVHGGGSDGMNLSSPRRGSRDATAADNADDGHGGGADAFARNLRVSGIFLPAFRRPGHITASNLHCVFPSSNGNPLYDIVPGFGLLQSNWCEDVNFEHLEAVIRYCNALNLKFDIADSQVAVLDAWTKFAGIYIKYHRHSLRLRIWEPLQPHGDTDDDTGGVRPDPFWDGLLLQTLAFLVKAMQEHAAKLAALEQLQAGGHFPAGIRLEKIRLCEEDIRRSVRALVDNMSLLASVVDLLREYHFENVATFDTFWSFFALMGAICRAVNAPGWELLPPSSSSRTASSKVRDEVCRKRRMANLPAALGFFLFGPFFFSFPLPPFCFFRFPAPFFLFSSSNFSLPFRRPVPCLAFFFFLSFFLLPPPQPTAPPPPLSRK